MLPHLHDSTLSTQAPENDAGVGDTTYLRPPRGLDHLRHRIDLRDSQAGYGARLVKEQGDTVDGRPLDALESSGEGRQPAGVVP
jgi:hypothetical protein